MKTEYVCKVNKWEVFIECPQCNEKLLAQITDYSNNKVWTWRLNYCSKCGTDIMPWTIGDYTEGLRDLVRSGKRTTKDTDTVRCKGIHEGV